jgi:hypothetical protein
MESEHQSLLARLEGYLGRRYAWFTLVLALVLILLLALAVLAESASGYRLGTAAWMLGLNPTMTVYILVIHPPMHRRWRHALRSLQALAPAADGAVHPKQSSDRGEWVAMLLGAIFGLVLARYTPGAEGWLRLYSEVTNALMFALLALVVYGGLARTRQLAARSRDGLELDVFDGHLLTPFARWGQAISLSFVGGICLSLLFQSYQSLHSLAGVLIYGCMIVASLSLFFMSLWAIHVALAKAQKRELVKVHRDLAAAREALRRYWAGNPAGTVVDAYLPVVACGIYEKQVRGASTWPFNPTIVRQLFASAAAPLFVYLLKLAFGIGGGV